MEGSTGGLCKLTRCLVAKFNQKEAAMEFSERRINMTPLFDMDVGLVGFGGYLKIESDCELELSLSVKIGGDTVGSARQQELPAGSWTPIGIHCRVPADPNVDVFVSAELRLVLRSKLGNIGKASFYGMELGAIDHPDYASNRNYGDGTDIHDKFSQKTLICVPYLYYFKHDLPFVTQPKDVKIGRIALGDVVLLKNCNRCGRYLLTEYEEDRQVNTVSFGIHCSNRDCTHSTFSKLKIERSEVPPGMSIPNSMELVKHGDDSPRVLIRHGYQLECKACKKFYVNAPLNPKRTSAQHREDSLRRRAIEVLAVELLENEWIYHEFRKGGIEFDDHIWKRFGKKCFNCGEDLPSCEDMHLDHTRPLSALWPLDEHATCLCARCNAQKNDLFPVEFYRSDKKLRELSEITGLSLSKVNSVKINYAALDKLLCNIEWFFDAFLSRPDYQKVRDGKKTADLVLKSLERRLDLAGENVDLIERYRKRTGKLPKSVTL